MRFIEITGKALAQIVSHDELHPDQLHEAGIEDDTIVRINEQGDIEVRRPSRWDLVGGLLGDFAHRIREKTGMEWV
jgi:hypothetical protein